MAEYITLLGAEQVQSAARQMQSAADDMQRAVGNLEDTLMRHRMFMAEWLGTFEQILTRYKPDAGGQTDG